MILARQTVLLAGVSFLLCGLVFLVAPFSTDARNVSQFSDTISDSRPNAYANHTFEFTIDSDIAPGGYLDFAFPAEFSIRSIPTFAERNVEMRVNGSTRNATTTLSATTDQIIITTGEPASVRYNLNTTTGLSSGDRIEFKIGNHTSNSRVFSQSFSTTTGTTTVQADVPGVQNASTTGKHKISMTSGGATNPVNTDFVVFLLEGVGVGPINTFETVPPFRFNGAPTGTIGGTTLNVEMSLETDELAVCRYSTVPGTAFSAMADVFENTGLLVHSEIITVVNDTTYTFYVRCVDDEGNFNTDDFIITFISPSAPTGDPNADGDNEGDGSGTGDDGSNTDGDESDGETSQPGSGDGEDGSTSSGGGGGGGGGGSGGGSGSDEAGGFENGEPFQSGDARVIINGFAYPGADVFVLVDGFLADDTSAQSDGKFSLTVEDIARGVYTFGIYAIDDDGVKSTTFSTTFTVSGGRSFNLSNINITPSVAVDPDPVDLGEVAIASGYTIPNAEVTIENESDSGGSPEVLITTSDNDGFWSVELDTAGDARGTYKIRAKGESEDVETDFSDYTFYGIGEEADAPSDINADLNRDGNVNLTDFSIMLFWWGGDGGDSDPPADINQDGSVSLTDFSILLFNWTG